MDSSLISLALLFGLICVLTCLPESLSTTTAPEQNVPQTCSMCCHGSPGQHGIPGAPGTPGAFGPTGPPGSKGDRGDKGEKGETGNEGLKGDKGSEGSPGREGPIGQNGPQGPQGNSGSKGEKGEPGLLEPQVRKSAFTAVRTTHVPTSESTILFTSMDINVGEDFDKNTGKFTCRNPGYYYFMFSFLSYSDSSTFVKMQLNGRVITSVYRSERAGHVQLSGGVTVELDVGDEVWLKNQERQVYGDSNHPFTFTGFMIYEMN